MNLNWIALAVPFFVALMITEYIVSIRKGKQVFSFAETVANINVGISERLCDIFMAQLSFYYFNWIYQASALFTIPSNWYTLLLLFLFTDLLWYWYHRFGHTVNLLWSAHVVHHQSEDYNYTVSARITIFQAVFRCLFWSFLPLAGFPPQMITIMLLIHGTYPFFTHTQLIGKLGVLELIFVTPSHHRVHHSSNPKYLDKNYGDVLIIWDKLFGTYVKEDEAPVYGITHPLKNHSFLWQHFHYPLEMLVAFYRVKGWRNKLKVIFGSPVHIDPRIRTLLERKLLRKPAGTVKRPLPIAIAVQTSITLLLLFFIILFEHHLGALQLVYATLFIFISVINTGAMLEQKDWVFYLEYTRLIVLYLFMLTFHLNPVVNIALLLSMVALGIYFKSLNEYYKAALYRPVISVANT